MIKGVFKTIKNETKEQKDVFHGMLLGTLGANLLGKVIGKEVKAKIPKRGLLRVDEGTIRAGEATVSSGFLMLPHPLNNFEVQKYYQNEVKFNGVYSQIKLPKIKDGAYVINLDEYKSIGAHWIAFYVNGNNGSASYNATYSDSFI